MGNYLIKLKGTNCYLKSTSANTINFTTDIKKAKVFTECYQKMDLIDKLNAGQYTIRKEGRHDFISLTMDKSTFQELYNNQFEQIKNISDSRKTVHQYSFSLADKFEEKAKTYQMTDEFPNYYCSYYGEDFEREEI
jgi:hypothetical protein